MKKQEKRRIDEKIQYLFAFIQFYLIYINLIFALVLRCD